MTLPAFVAAFLGLALNYAAYESEIYRASLEAIGRGQLEAARTLGFSEWQILRLIRAPQAFRLALAPMTNDFVALLKDSSLVSVLTVVELTKQTQIFAANLGSWALPGALCAALYLAMSLPLSALARRVLKARKENADCEVFVWRDGFEDWLPPQVVAEVFAAMEQRKSKVKAAQRAPARPPAALPPVSNPRPPASARSQPSSPPRPPARASAASLGAPPRPPTSGRSAGAPPPTPAGSTGSLGAPPPWSPPAVNASARLRASSADVEASSPAASLTPEMKRAPAPEGRGHRDVGALGGPPPPGAAAAQAGGLGGLPPPPSAGSADEALDAIGRSPRLPSGGLQLDAAHAVALPSVSSPSQPAPSPIAQLLHAQDAGRAAQGAEGGLMPFLLPSPWDIDLGILPRRYEGRVVLAGAEKGTGPGTWADTWSGAGCD